MPYLAMILFSPWFVILGVLFAVYPRSPRTWTRNAFDLATLGLAGVGSFIGMRWAYLTASVTVGTMWKQIFPTLVAYGIFLGVMAIALLARHRVLRR